MQRRIKRAWFPPKGSESKRVVVSYNTHKNGEVSEIKIEQSSGVQEADDAAVKAVHNASPLRKLPEGSKDPVNFQFNFDYNVFSGGGGAFRKF
jgi:TonB family protein